MKIQMFDGWSKEEIKNWIDKLPEEPGGLMACSPEIYAEMQELNKKADAETPIESSPESETE